SCTRHVGRALRQASARAWAAVEMLLAGEEFWERAQLFWERDLEQEFFQPIRFLLDTISLAPVDRLGPDARLRVRQALYAAIKNGLLTTGSLEFADLFPQFVTHNSATQEPSALTAESSAPKSSESESSKSESLSPASLAEMPAILRLTAELDQSGHAELGALFELQCESDRSLLIFLVGQIFRVAVEAAADLFGSMAECCINGNVAPVGAELRAAALALHRYVGRVDAILQEIRQTLPAAIPLAAVLPVDGFAIHKVIPEAYAEN